MPGFHSKWQGVSTHSRLKAAGSLRIVAAHILKVSTHSRLKAAGNVMQSTFFGDDVSTHSRLKAAGYPKIAQRPAGAFQHTAA